MCDLYGFRKLKHKKNKIKKKLSSFHSRKKTNSENEPINQTQSQSQSSTHEVSTVYENVGK